MTDRAKELIADCRKRARAAWETDGTVEGDHRRNANFRPDAIRDIEQLATIAEQAIAQNDSYHAAVQVLHSRLEAEHARAEKAEADLAEARRMLKEAGLVPLRDSLGREMVTRSPAPNSGGK